MRAVLAVLHRWIGLALAGFLFVAGTTGSVIALYHELDEGLNPQLYLAPGRGEVIGPSELVARVERALPQARVSGLPLDLAAGHAAVLRVAPRSGAVGGAESTLGFDELFVDPVDGTLLGRRLWGECCFSRERIIPFLYSLHYSLHLPERAGMITMGCVALAWSFDCFVALALTLPRGDGFWRRWRRAFRVERGASRYRLWHDVHQASGLWLWPLLLALALSGVALSLRDEVFRPFVGLFSTLSPTPLERALELDRSPGNAALDFSAAIDRSREIALARGWPAQPVYAFHWAEVGGYGVGFVRPGDDPEVGLGASWIYLDDRDGRFVSADVVGEGSAGDAFTRLQFPLHSGHVFGLPGRIAVSLLGAATALLSATGVYVWAVKRAARGRTRRDESATIATSSRS
jgi:uncharacterized iron-regulated membrane protein